MRNRFCLGDDRETSVLGDKDRNPYQWAALCREGGWRREGGWSTELKIPPGLDNTDPPKHSEMWTPAPPTTTGGVYKGARMMCNTDMKSTCIHSNILIITRADVINTCATL